MKISSAPKTRATAKTGSPASSAPSAMYHLHRNPAVGGMPTIEMAPIETAAVVNGIERPTPASPVSVRCPVWWMSAPAPRKSVALMSAWLNTCTLAPISEYDDASPRPITM